MFVNDNLYYRWEAAMSALLMVCALAFKPTIKLDKSDMHKSLSEELRSLVNIDIWKNPKYVIWATMIPLALFGYFVPYVHLVRQSFFFSANSNIVWCLFFNFY